MNNYLQKYIKYKKKYIKLKKIGGINCETIQPGIVNCLDKKIKKEKWSDNNRR